MSCDNPNDLRIRFSSYRCSSGKYDLTTERINGVLCSLANSLVPKIAKFRQIWLSQGRYQQNKTRSSGLVVAGAFPILLGGVIKLGGSLISFDAPYLLGWA